MTEAGLRNNISVAVQYLASWLRGGGAVAINNMMEDAATAEICRSQVWQWLHNDVKLNNGRPVTRRVVSWMLTEELARSGRDYTAGRDLFEEVTLTDDYVDFLTLPAYERMP